MSSPASRPAPGLIVAAPASGSGKTLFTQALLRLLRNNGHTVGAAKTGPDYIDPHFHALASGQTCLNLDSWAMRRATLERLLDRLSETSDLILCEGVMGLFDGADTPDDLTDGSTASLARLTGWPVVLIVDTAKQAASVAALVRGFVEHAPDVAIAGVVFNRVGSPAHEAILRRAMRKHLPDVPIFGALPRRADLVLPERHLGLVQARELQEFEDFVEGAAAWLTDHLDWQKLIARARPAAPAATGPSSATLLAGPQLPPLGHRIAVADDAAFAFSYGSLIQGWRDAGAEIQCFSPLAGASPDAACDAVYLPGGYPELYAGSLASNGFPDGLRQAAARGAVIFGECGGYMVLGDGLVDAEGTHHRMAGLLPVETSFETPRLHLGYRQARLLTDGVLGRRGELFRGHEFHYASVLSTRATPDLFAVCNAAGADLGAMGFQNGRVAGSFLHLIDGADPGPAV